MVDEKLNRRLQSLSAILGFDIALFCICAAYDWKYDPEIEFGSVDQYKAKIGTRRFLEGITNIALVAKEDEDLDTRWKMVWGIGNRANPYTEEDYRRLDQLFETYSSRLRGAGGMDALQEDTLRSCSKMRLQADQALARGTKDDIAIANTLNKMIQENLSAEQLRKKDAKPIETTRIDGIVDAISKKYGNDVFLSQEEAIEMCAKWYASHHYNMTMDAADHMLMAIINTTRNNNDMPELKELPKNARFSDDLASSFETDPDDREKETYEYLGLRRNRK